MIRVCSKVKLVAVRIAFLLVLALLGFRSLHQDALSNEEMRSMVGLYCGFYTTTNWAIAECMHDSNYPSTAQCGYHDGQSVPNLCLVTWVKNDYCKEVQYCVDCEYYIDDCLHASLGCAVPLGVEQETKSISGGCSGGSGTWTFKPTDVCGNTGAGVACITDFNTCNGGTYPVAGYSDGGWSGERKCGTGPCTDDCTP